MRLEVLNPPYVGVDAERLAKFQPPGAENQGMELLHSVRMLVRHHPDLAEALRQCAWFFLDETRNSLSVRDRELAIFRTLGLCRCEYEWGIHVAVYAEPAGLSAEQCDATVNGSPDDPIWDARDTAILRAVDELVAANSLTDDTWKELSGHLSSKQTLEFLALVGWYQLTCNLSNSAQLPLEPFAARFP